jgi:hypothetical protein
MAAHNSSGVKRRPSRVRGKRARTHARDALSVAPRPHYLGV